MEARVEAQVETGFMRQRLVLSLVAAALIVTIASAVLVTMKKKGAKAGAAGGGSAAAAASADSDGKKEKGKEKEKTPVPVTISNAAVRPISSYVTATANLVAENEVKIVSEADGRIAQLLVEEGAYVRAGQPLASLVRGDEEIALTKARVRAKNAQAGFNRAKEMRAKELISQGDYDKTTMENEVAAQEVAEAQWRLNQTTIRAPFDGRVTNRAVTRGQHLRPGDVLFTLTDFDPLVARIYLPERDVVALSEGREVRIRLKADENTVFRGRVRQISPVVDTATGTVKVTVEAVTPPPAARPGAFITIDITRETRPGALVVPREAVVRELREAHVFVAAKGVARKRSISVGLEEGAFVQVTSGLRAGEQVIVAGQGGLKDGSPVKVLPAKG